MRLNTIILIAAMTGCTTAAHAIPNMWTSGFGQGVTEYLITSPDNVVFNLNCTMNPDEQDVLQHGVLITMPDGTILDSHDEKTAMTVVTDNRQYPLPATLGWRNGDNAWVNFIDALGQAATFDVYVNDKKVGHFSPGSDNTKAELADLNGCRNTAG
ncbi:hypothetical protein SM100_004066 [Cronobacter sakazakii]|nr:hypothetical protein [Cronobacter sakazakii]ELY4815237.1 hypothetical protein [Cronobacter sakazakii]